jgi:Protein of unknown function (DUF4038)/Putative collagen-binding domain of a collagenase
MATTETTNGGPLTRRRFLEVASASLGTLGLAACGRSADAPTTPPPPASASSNVFPLRRPPARRFLETRGGAPFFLLGDTAWSLAVSASQSDAIRYLDNRKANDFNALTFNAIEAEFAGGNGNTAPNNWYGQSPFQNLEDFTTPREEYWTNVDFIVQQAAARDMLCVIFPAYEGYGQGSQGWYRRMAAQGTTKLHRYGAWLAERYRTYDNILWVAGGDNDAPNKELTKAVVGGINSVSTKWLFAWHGARNTNALSFWAGDLGWLDLNTIYDSPDHAAVNAAATYGNPTVKPFARIEDTYENPIVGGVSPAFIRWLAWSSALQGGTGAIYGDVAVWRFNGPGVVKDPTSWVAAMDRPAGASMRYLKRLLESTSWTKLVPDFPTASGGSAASTAVNLAAIADDRSFGVAYSDNASKDLTFDLYKLSGPNVLVRWYDPTNGGFVVDGTYAAGGSRPFVRKALNAEGSADWALLFEST